MVPFLSSVDIGAGTPWMDELRKALKENTFGIVCIIPEYWLFQVQFLHIQGKALRATVYDFGSQGCRFEPCIAHQAVRRLDFLRARAEKQAGLCPWPRNALRHCFISYALAIDHDENRIALESGNTPDVIHTKYRALVTREEAEKFWNIRSLVNTPTNGTKNFRSE